MKVMNHQATVFLEKCHSYDRNTLKDFFESFFTGSQVSFPRGARVILKPNLITCRGPQLACTNGTFLLALADLLVDNGAHVTIGDSPAFGNTIKVLKHIGVAEEFSKRSVRVVNFDEEKRVRLDCGIELGIAAEALECDYFINVPKVKAHSQMYVTLAVKNLFGTVRGLQKPMLHMKHGGRDNTFSRIIVDLIGILPTHYALIDGIEAMHVTGPVHGESLELGCIGFSENPVALDTAIMGALELDWSKSPLWREAQRRKLDGIKIEDLYFPRLSPDSFHGLKFEAPDRLSPVRFNPFHFIRGVLQRVAGNNKS